MKAATFDFYETLVFHRAGSPCTTTPSRALRGLRDRGLRLGVISDWHRGLGHFCAELEIGRGSPSQYVSNPVEGGLDTLRSGALNLGKAAGKVCYPARHSGDTDCRILDRYGAAQKKAKDEARRR